LPSPAGLSWLSSYLKISNWSYFFPEELLEVEEFLLDEELDLLPFPVDEELVVEVEEATVAGEELVALIVEALSSFF